MTSFMKPSLMPAWLVAPIRQERNQGLRIPREPGNRGKHARPR